MRRRVLFLFAVIVALLAVTSTPVGAQQLPALTETTVTSSLDGKPQSVLYWAPKAAAQRPTTLFVFLHSWSSGYKQNNSKWQKVAVEQGWIFLHADFRGKNNTPQACGSKFARQDILDAMDFICGRFKVDRSRIYLCGVSGGGHMSMLMAGHHPDRFSAVSAWVGISDLAEWYRFHLKDGKPQRYAQMIQACLQGPPGTSNAIDADYKDRSPLFHIHKVGDLPVDIFAGVNDGHTGSVPVSHSIKAFNQIAKAHGNAVVTDDEIEQLWSQRKLDAPRESDKAVDTTLGREIKLRRTSNSSRLTIFDGGHESIPAAAVEWLKRQQRATVAN